MRANPIEELNGTPQKVGRIIAKQKRELATYLYDSGMVTVYFLLLSVKTVSHIFNL